MIPKVFLSASICLYQNIYNHLRVSLVDLTAIYVNKCLLSVIQTFQQMSSSIFRSQPIYLVCHSSTLSLQPLTSLHEFYYISYIRYFMRLVHYWVCSLGQGCILLPEVCTRLHGCPLRGEGDPLLRHTVHLEG